MGILGILANKKVILEVYEVLACNPVVRALRSEEQSEPVGTEGDQHNYSSVAVVQGMVITAK